MRPRASTRLIVLALTGSVAFAGSVRAQSASEQKSACMGDAFRFCSAAIPDRQKVGICLAAHRDQISPACRAMMDGGGTRPTPRRG